MLKGKGPDDIEAQPLAAVVRPACKAALENMRHVLRGYAAARIADGYDGVPILTPQRERYPPSRRSEGQRVVAEVFKRGAQALLFRRDVQLPS